MFSMAHEIESESKLAVPRFCATTVRVLGCFGQGERIVRPYRHSTSNRSNSWIPYPQILFIVLTLAILPSPSPKDEFRDPFSQRRISEDHAVNSSQPPFRLRSTPGNSFNESLTRPSLRRGNSTASLQSSSTDEETRRKSGHTSVTGHRDSDISSELDLQSVMRASLAIQEGAHVQNIILKLVRIIMLTAGANYGVVMLRDQNLEKRTLYIEVIGEGAKVNLVDHKPLHSQIDVVPARLCE
jgi:hypothetical protein